MGGLCMGNEGGNQKNAPEVPYEESLFTVAQLYQLCSVCGMLDNGGANAADKEGWVVSNGAKGCIHPDVSSQKEVLGVEICTERHLLPEAEAKCSEDFNKDGDDTQKNWYDSCLAETCNSGDADGVHAVVAAIKAEVDAGQVMVEEEFGFDS